MRQGIVAAGVLLLALTVGSWFTGSTPADDSDAAIPSDTDTSSEAVVLEIVSGDGARTVAPSTTTPPTTTPPATTPPTTLGPPSSTSVLPATTVAMAVSDPEAAFAGAIDELRNEAGLPALRRDPELDEMARSWAETMAADGSLRHSSLIYDVIAGVWKTAGENVGYGPSWTVIHDALAASPGHLANMINPDFAAFGIGVVREGDVMWTAHLYAG